MGNIHKQFGGSGLVGSMLSLDGIDCSAVYPNDLDSSNHGSHERDNSTIKRERERNRASKVQRRKDRSCRSITNKI